MDKRACGGSQWRIQARFLLKSALLGTLFRDCLSVFIFRDHYLEMKYEIPMNVSTCKLLISAERLKFLLTCK